MNRPTLLQTNKPDQSLNISLQGSLNESAKKPLDSSTKVLKINEEFSPYHDQTPTMPNNTGGISNIIDCSKQEAYQKSLNKIKFQAHDSHKLRAADQQK